MKLLAIPLLAIAVIFGIALAGPIQQRWEDQNSYQHQVEQLQLAQKELDLQQYQATQPGRITSDYIWRMLAAVAAGGLIYVVGDMYRTRQRRVDDDRRLVYPNAAGYLPAPRSAIERGELVDLLADALRAAGVAQIEAARNPGTPHSISYSPKFSSHMDASAAPVPELPSAASVPTFAELLDRGRIGKGNPLVLGYDESDASEITGSWLDLYSTIVAGMPGTGKTTSQRFLACQTALQGARFAVIDPHAGAADDSLAATLQPLASAFVCEPASSDKAILEVVRYVADVGARRIAGKDSDTTPLILWADEMTALLGRSSVGDKLAQLLERIAQEYRKRFVFVCGSGQIWTASRSTSELRDSFASVMCHRMKRGQARLLLPTEEAGQVERLQTGHAVLWRTSGATQSIVVPNTTGGDVRRVAQLLLTDSQPTLETAWKPLGNGLENAESAPGSAKPQSAAAVRILAMFADGADVPAIARALYGATTGRKYQEVTAEIYRVLREEIGTR